MNKIVCMGLLCMVGVSVIASETPKSGLRSLHSSAELRKSIESLRSSDPIAIKAMSTRAKRDPDKTEDSSSGSQSSGSSPVGVYLFPGQGHDARAFLCPIDPTDPNMGRIWPYYR